MTWSGSCDAPCVNPVISATEPATSESAVQQSGSTGIRSAVPPNLPAQ